MLSVRQKKEEMLQTSAFGDINKRISVGIIFIF